MGRRSWISHKAFAVMGFVFSASSSVFFLSYNKMIDSLDVIDTLCGYVKGVAFFFFVVVFFGRSSEAWYIKYGCSWMHDWRCNFC